jgi:hypothetical protein
MKGVGCLGAGRFSAVALLAFLRNDRCSGGAPERIIGGRSKLSAFLRNDRCSGGTPDATAA